MHGCLWHGVVPTLVSSCVSQDDWMLTSLQVLDSRRRQLSVQLLVFSQGPKVKGSEIYLLCIFLEHKDGQLTIVTCAVFITAKNLFFVTKMVNVLWNFFLLLKIPRTYKWILLIAEPVAACPSRPWAHIWGRRNWWRNWLMKHLFEELVQSIEDLPLHRGTSEDGTRGSGVHAQQWRRTSAVLIPFVGISAYPTALLPSGLQASK